MLNNNKKLTEYFISALIVIVKATAVAGIAIAMVLIVLLGGS